MSQQPDLWKAQLFLDDTWIEDATFVNREWHQPRKYPGPVLAADHPWEYWCPVAYGTVLYHEDRFKMWYCGWTREPHPRVCYAESRDGVAWEKPALGIHDFGGSKENNIVLVSADGEQGLIDDITVIHDPEDGEWPLKALFWDGCWSKPPEERGIFAARSKDGIHWDRSPGLVLPRWGDRFNAVSEKVGGKYLLFGRAPGGHPLGKGRIVWRTESEDLLHWSAPELVLSRDHEDPVPMEYYSLTAFPYEGLLLGAIERMHMSPDKLDPELVFSHDGGRTWGRSRTRPAFLSWGAEKSWDDTWINLPANAPIRHEKRLWFYYSGRSGAHGAAYPHNEGGIGLALLRVDGFASLRAQERPGIVLTRPMTWPQADLYVNLDPRRDIESHPGFTFGEARVEVRDAAGQPVPGFTKEESVPLTGNTANWENACAPVAWNGGRSLAELAGQPIRLAFHLRDAHLYSFRAGEIRPKG